MCRIIDERDIKEMIASLTVIMEERDENRKQILKSLGMEDDYSNNK
jgi:hypothetical protein